MKIMVPRRGAMRMIPENDEEKAILRCLAKPDALLKIANFQLLLNDEDGHGPFLDVEKKDD